MGPRDTRIAYAVVLDMMPKPGIAGVELDSRAYKDILKEHVIKSAGGNAAAQIDKQVRHILRTIGSYGFGAFEHA